MKGSRRFWIIVAAVVVGVAIFRWIVVAPMREAVAREQRQLKNVEADRAGHFRPEGTPIALAQKQLAAERARLDALKETLGHAVLEIPEELRPGAGRDILYFQRKLAELGTRAAQAKIEFSKKAPQIGFPADAPSDKADEYLARLAVARLIVEAAAAAGVSEVLEVEHPAVRVVGTPEVDIEVEELPCRLTVATDERGLARLLQQISQPRKFLALKDLKIEVRDPDSGAFHATLELAGLSTRKAQKRTPDEPGKPAAPAPGVTVPVRPRRF